jgi:hypothetical protein
MNRKTKILAFRGKQPILSKILKDNRILARDNELSNLDYSLAYLGEVDISNKISKYTETMEIINIMLKPSLV